MNNETNNLYNELVMLKNSLQNQYIENGRKPTICTEETLRLLAKYKPRTIEDMDNISGVGTNFIEKYGTVFLDVIKKYTTVEKEEITENEKIILSKLENRLVNINKRNRLLYSGKVNKDNGVDAIKYFDNYVGLETFLITRDTSSFKLIDLKTYDEQKLKTINKILRQAEKIEVDSGNKELYIAYPFVQGRFEYENFNVKAPLMLFPIEIGRDANTIFIKNDNSRDIIYNTTLILANNKFKGKNQVLPDNDIDEFDPEHYIEKMLSFYSDNEFYIKDNNTMIEEFLETTQTNFPQYRPGEFEIRKYMVFGLYSTYVTSMYADFHKMIENKDITSLIKDLLWGAEKSLSNVDQNEDANITSNDINTIEEDIYYINELDSSQEKVLEGINQYKSLVVQGPPGTGKSQTITSIVAEAILQGKKVLMVSEKKTALDVIYSRLGYLSKFALILDDIENKDAFYNQINTILETIRIDSPKVKTADILRNDYKREVEGKINNINTNLSYLDEIGSKIYETNSSGTNMYNLYNNCKKINLNNGMEINQYRFLQTNNSNIINTLNYKDLENIYNEFNNIDTSNSLDKYLSIVRDNINIKEIKNNLSDMELFELKEKLIDLKTYLVEYNNYSIFKKLFNKGNLKDRVNNILNKYFKTNNKNLYQYLISKVDYILEFLNIYQDFISNQFIYDKLSNIEKEYIRLIDLLEQNFKISFNEANNLLFNYTLFEKIMNFEKTNITTLNYINNFSSIRSSIGNSIGDKKDLTRKMAELELLQSAVELNGNNKINKIEEMCNRKRKMSINKFMSKYKLEMLDSIRIWLVTPEVVSDILPFEKNLFDIVIFDEASQLYVEKAIPAIYRAKKVVVAGDQKQLKPSSLGKGRILDEIDEEEIDDGFLEYESLLDAANYKFEHTMLNYHYRSKYNELIAFSNYAFYNGKLMVTSLAKAPKEKPIERIFVNDGRWIDKKNVAEAHEVVNLVKRIMNTRKNNETIGVITFNSSQMNLIEDIIDKEMGNDSNFAAMITNEKNRTDNGENIGFFVKNIETVQGDERDIIIFCIGYAKNENGKVAINFGWLNQDGGENRLNVAISRAKSKIYVVTSIEPEELVVDSTKNDGPKLFKEYLRYVKAIDTDDKELTESILMNLSNVENQETKEISYDKIYNDVKNALLEKGYNVQTQYGVGGYKIDLVVKSNDGENNLLGIECDGRLYKNSNNARERDYHRQKYLESRGWDIYRIWTSNWWKNPDLEIKKLDDYLKKIIEQNGKEA